MDYFNKKMIQYVRQKMYFFYYKNVCTYINNFLQTTI